MTRSALRAFQIFRNNSPNSGESWAAPTNSCSNIDRMVASDSGTSRRSSPIRSRLRRSILIFNVSASISAIVAVNIGCAPNLAIASTKCPFFLSSSTSLFLRRSQRKPTLPRSVRPARVPAIAAGTIEPLARLHLADALLFRCIGK